MKSNYVIFRVGDNDFGIEIQYVISIEKVTEITCLPQMPDYIKGITNIRGQMKGVIDAATLLFNQSIEIDESTRFLLLDIHQSDIALMVSKTNEILSIDEAEIKPIDSINATSEIFKGVALIDNRMISILNIEKLFSTLDALETVSAVHLG
ncbi:chemotaxis protein CheW [Margalitia sp. FSL K6-0131]|uniref:chemotaxis protein CheW n=1 Tax=Margalitia sp. FSL K6-0131 TaxID=2954604 RepID=UPI0030FB21BE